MAINAAVELISRIALKWMDNRPFSEEAKIRRQAKRAARKAARQRQPDESGGEFFPPQEDKPLAINTGLRSSSNSAIAAVIVNVVVAVVNGVFPDFTIPNDWLVYLTAGAM